MRSKFLIILLTYSYCVQSQSVLLDSLVKKIENHPAQDSVRVNLLTSAARNARYTNPQLTRRYSEEAITLASYLNFTKGIGDGYTTLSLYYWSQTDYTKCIDYSLLAIKEYEKINYQPGISECFGTIAIGHAQGKNYEESIRYSSKALEINKKIGNTQGIARNLNNLGYVYELKKDFTKALTFYEEALALREKLGNENEVIMPMINVAGIHMTMGNFHTAKPIFRKALTQAETLDNKNMVAYASQCMGELSFKMGSYIDARKYLDMALNIAFEIGDNKRKEEVYELLKNIEKSRGNYKDAFLYQEKLSGLRDTLFSQERARQLAQFQSQIEYEKQERAIEVLERDKRIKTLWNNLLIGVLILVVIGFSVFYRIRAYREKRNIEFLNLQIDLLTSRQKELTEKYQDAITQISEAPRDSQDQRLLQKAIQIVEQNLSDPGFGVEKMSLEIGMSRTNLHRRLKTVSGFAPSDFIRNVRLKRAASLLRQNSDSVSQIGFHVGFEDQSYFSKCFKKHFGVSPSEYARSSSN